jgi:(E)-4-hydroxy-3-methylbut-2-enyl-diphosphate synthase
MSQAGVRPAEGGLEAWRKLWSFTLDPYRTVRRPTRVVRVGDVGIGGSNPIRIQSMTIADTLDTATVVDEIAGLAAAGCEIVRVTAPNRKAAENLRAIRGALRQRALRVPLVADVHFTPQAALIAAEHVEKVRINPGNYADRKHFKKWEYTDAEYAEELERLEEAFRPLVLRCRELGVAMRIGTNHGSLSDRILNRYGDTPLGMVESALEFVRICELHGYRDLVLSMKASDVKVMIAAYRLLARRLGELGMDYPLHLGVTEAGAGLAARVKSSIGIATLLDDGIGDTIRVSLTEPSVQELPVARAIAQGGARSAVAGAVAEPPLVPRWDPCTYNRRAVAAVGWGPARLGSDQPPRIEVVLPPPQDPAAIPAWLERELAPVGAAAGADLALIAVPPDARISARVGAWKGRPLPSPSAAPAVGIELPVTLLRQPAVREAIERSAWARLSVCVDAERIVELEGRALAELQVPLQYTLTVGERTDLSEIGARLGAGIASGQIPFAAVALDLPRQNWTPAHALRALLAGWPAGVAAVPVVLRGPAAIADDARVDAHVSHAALRVAAGLGSLLSDGIGEAVQLHAEAGGVELGREILQATRMRLSRADFIACPSCGRTQFDLQTTTERIQGRLGHLKELKIAVMGCIVNGPGEMADADFGYVGSGPGRIDLYVGHERVERNVAEAEAVDRLIDLIRGRGRWTEPGSGR